MRSIESQSLQALDWPDILKALSAQARSIEGRKRAAALPLFEHRIEAVACLSAVEELQDLESLGDRMPCGAMPNLCEALASAQKGSVLSLEELSEAADCLASMHQLERWIQERAERAPHLDALASTLLVDRELKKEMVDSFEEPGVLSVRRYPDLRRLRQEISTISAQVQRTLDRLLKEPRIRDLLQDTFVTVRGDRTVLPIRASAKRAGLGIVHDSSASGETVFIEPTEIVELHNQKREAQAALRREEARIRSLLSKALGEQCDEIVAGLEAAWSLDLVAARMGLGCQLGASIPQVGDEGIIEIDGAKHPLLVLAEGSVVANGLSLTPEFPGLVLTGPNAGGKTVALKTLALAALFVRAGIPFPAKQGLRFDFFSRIVADIGDAQRLSEGLSTFSAHMLTLKKALDLAAPNCLVLLDELAVGTDPTQGAALARVVLQDLVDAGARVVTTTHYTELKGLPAIDSRFRGAAVAFSDGRPTYSLRMGELGLSHAFAIASQMGLSADLISRAKAALSEHERSWLDQSEELAEAIAAQRATQKELDEALASARAAKAKHIASHERIKAQRQAILEDEQQQSRERQREAEAQIKAIIAELQGRPSLKKAGDALSELRSKQAIELPAETTQQDRLKSVALGQQVQVLSLGKSGLVCAEPRGDKVEIQIGAIKTWVDIGDLAASSSNKKKQPRVVQKPEQSLKGSSLRMESNSLDLRGLRAEEALQRVDFFLDRMLQDGSSVAYLLHGHGTGALKKAVREWLGSCPIIESWRPGSESEGGDAFTRVELR